MSVRTIPYMEKTWFGFGPERPMKGFSIIECTCDTCGFQERGSLGVWTGLSLSPRWLRRNLPNGRAKDFCCYECANKKKPRQRGKR